MNTVDAWVKEIISKPYKEYGKWWVKVIAGDGYGPDHETSLMFDTIEKAERVTIGYQFEW